MNTETINFHGTRMPLIVSENAPKNGISFISYTRNDRGVLQPRYSWFRNIGDTIEKP